MEFGLSRGVPDLRRAASASSPATSSSRRTTWACPWSASGCAGRAATPASASAPTACPSTEFPSYARRLPRGHRRPRARAGRDARGRGARLAHRALRQRAALPARAGRRPADRWITHRLYDPTLDCRVAQEILLGIGGVRALRTLGIDVDIYHFNEGHAVFAGIELIAERMAAGAVVRRGVGARCASRSCSPPTRRSPPATRCTRWPSCAGSAPAASWSTARCARSAAIRST